MGNIDCVILYYFIAHQVESFLLASEELNMDKRKHLQYENDQRNTEYWEIQIKVLQLQGLRIIVTDILMEEASGNSPF